MEAHEAVERFEHSHHASHEGGGFATQAALVVAVIAAFLAVATFKANEAVKETIQEQTKVSDTHFQDQTQLGRQIELQLDRALLSAIAINSPAQKQLLAIGNQLDQTATSLDPVIKKLGSQAREQTRSVNHSNNQHLLFELAVVGLQIGIVLASVSIIVRRRWLLGGGALVAVAGVGLLIAGFAS
jgi:preprotein translocase subunit SecF